MTAVIANGELTDVILYFVGNEQFNQESSKAFVATYGLW
jgi:hypothetical protein